MERKRPVNLKYCLKDPQGHFEKSYPIIHERVRDLITPWTPFGHIIQMNYKNYVGFTKNYAKRYDSHEKKWMEFHTDPSKIIDSFFDPAKYRGVKRPDLMYILYETENYDAAMLMERTLLHKFEGSLCNDPLAKNRPPRETESPYFVYFIANLFVR